MSPEPVHDRLAHALARRRRLGLLPDTNAVRLVHGPGDGLPGLVIEQWGSVLTAQIHVGRAAPPDAELRDLCEQARIATNAAAVYRKHFVRDRSFASSVRGAARRPDAGEPREHHDPQPWLGDAVAPEIAVREHGATFLIRPYDGFSVGLFLDQRDNRLRVRQRAAGRRVLNTFSYTGGFSVCAALGGAAETASVDVSRKALEWSQRNFAANGLDTGRHRFYCRDVLDFFRRAERQGRRYDLIILDPPTFARAGRTGRTFAIESDLARLVAGAVRLAEPGAELLVCTNHRGTSCAALERAVRDAAPAARVRERPALPADFPGDPDYAKSVWMEL